MLFLKVKDFKKRIFYKRTERQIKINKFIFINFLNNIKFIKKKKLKKNFRFAFLKAFYLRKKSNFFKSSKTKIISNCILNKKTKSVSKFYHISRSAFRDLMQFGLVPGYKKAVW